MKMKPVFSNREDKDRSLDVTTVSKVVETKETPISNVVNMVTKEEAENIARQYADQASEQAVNVALEKYDSRRREDEERRRRDEAERGAEIEAKRRRRKEDEDDGDDSSLSVINPKVVKQLKDTVSIFTALKELSSNPLQKTIEETVGGMAAGVVQKAFSPPSQHQEKDIIDRILNSNFASGLGAGLGQRGPELVDTFTRNFGKEKVDGWITGAVKGGGSGGGIGGLGGMPGMGSIGGQSKQQSEMEMVLSLDRNNPEHVAAYAHSQGDMTIETARKVLGIHQDDFIDQLKKKGVDTSPYETRRHQEINQNQNQGMSNQSQQMPNQYQEVPNQNQYQEYRRPPPRVNEDLIVNTPATEDNRWREQQNAVNEQQSAVSEQQNAVKREDEKSDTYVNNLETQNVELHPQNSSSGNNSEIMIYLKNMNEQLKLSNDSIIGLKDISEQLKLSVEKQNNDMFNLQSELEVIKKDRNIPDETTVRSMKMIKKGFSYVKTEE